MGRILAFAAAGLLAVALLAYAVLYYRSHAAAEAGAGYVAHQMCSCVFVTDRSYASCLKDMLPVMDTIRSETVERDESRGVRAFVPLFADRTALYSPDTGCTLY